MQRSKRVRIVILNGGWIALQDAMHTAISMTLKLFEMYNECKSLSSKSMEVED